MGTILVTGVAGFIGFHVAVRLLADGNRVVGLDNMSPYYDVTLKQARLDQLTRMPNFVFRQLDVADREPIHALADEFPEVERIIHLAAQPGVRHSLIDPYTPRLALTGRGSFVAGVSPVFPRSHTGEIQN